MKKITFLLLTLLFFTSHAWSQCESAVALTPGTQQCGNTSTFGDPIDDSSCLGNYDGGNDALYVYTATENGETLDLTLSGQASYTGFAISKGCPTGGTEVCVGSLTSSGSGTLNFVSDPLEAGQVYYIHISTWPSPQTTGYCLDATLIAAPTCPAPSVLQVGLTSTSSAELSWTVGGTESLWNIEYGLAGYTQGSGTTVSASTNPYTLNGLTSGTTYDIYIQADCGAGDTSSWVGPLSFTTLCEAFDIPYTENFDSTSTGTSSNPTVPNCWSFIDSGSGYGYVSSTGANSFYLYNSSDGTGDYILVSPETNALSSGTNRVTFDVDGSMSQQLIVGTLSDPADASTFTAIETITLATNDYESYVIDITTGTDLHLGFKHGQTGTFDSYYLDNITVEPIPSCLEVSGLATADLTSSSAVLSWTADASQSLFNVEVVDITAGGSVTGTPTHSGVANPYTLTGLTANNEYEFYVQADCGGGDTSSWVGPLSFTTACFAISSFPWTEDFESVTTPALPSCFSELNNNSDTDYWKTYTTYGTGSSKAVGMYTDFNSGNNDDYLILPQFTLTGNERLKYSVRARSSTEPNDYKVVLSTTGNSAADFTTDLMALTTVSNTSHEEQVIDLSAYSGNVYIAIHVPSGGLDGYYIYFDDFTVELSPTDAMDWNNLQWLQPTADGAAGSRTSVTVDAGTSITAYAQGYEGGVTDTTAGSAGAGIECWIGIHNENTDPATWPASAWSVATFDSEQGNNNNDEYKFTTTDAAVGTNYVASRWRLNNAGFTYGGTNPSDPGLTPGGPWDGTTNLSIQLIVNPIANDDCSGAIALTVNSDLACGTVTSGSVEFATDSGVTNSTCSGTEDDDVWYSFVATSESHVVSLSNVSGSVTDMYHALYAGDCNTLGAAITCSDSNTSETTGLTIGNTYYVQVYTYTSTAGQNTSFDICVGTPPPPPSNDSCDSATVLDTLPYTSNADATSATNNSGVIDNVCGTNGMNDGVWYTFTPTVSGTIDLTLTPTGWDAEIAVYTGSCGVFTCVDRADSGGTGVSESLSISVTAGTQYFVNLGHYSDFSDNSEGVYEFSATSADASLGVDDNSISLFNYFPNPVNDVLTIKAQKEVDYITVYNMLGQVVKRQTPNTRDCTVDLSAMQTGAYFVQVSIDNSVETIRILKN